MFIRIKDLEVRKIDFDEDFLPGTIDFGPEVRQSEALRARGRAELIREHHGHEVVEDIRLVGQLSGAFAVNCARCLEPVRQKLNLPFDLLYRPLQGSKSGEEVSISESETEIGFYSGEGMELGDSIREQALLALPVKVVCREDCKGLCPRCGKNLNQESCNCSSQSEDPRWNALRDLRDKL